MQRYFTSKKNNNEFILSDNDIYHIKVVMRMKNNEKIEIVFDNKLYICHIEDIDSNIRFVIDEIIENNNIRKNQIFLAIPLLKEQKMDLIIQKATELGVDGIIPFNAERSIIKLDKTKEIKKIERWQKIAREASEQSKRFDIPVIESVKSIDELIKYNYKKIICSTKKDVKNIKYLLQNISYYDKLLLVIGPEGGLSDLEEKYLIDNGFIPVSLGNLIMRVETVPLFLLSIINYESME